MNTIKIPSSLENSSTLNTIDSYETPCIYDRFTDSSDRQQPSLFYELGTNLISNTLLQINSLCLSHQYIASFDEEGEQTPGWRRVGPEGLINLEKVYRTQAVMDHIASFHQHHYALARNHMPVFGDYLR